ncbi:desulfoferrodoxin family protein [[Mycoplasma] testudinis]|uniref:desulfoferrodoxin family protein n=1 Tax=[Mycoplasma] testudinis TaxID=33924 RepID=UPI000489B67B|nr:desulfoferrodoxin family protein [[Mycoplasma] testudinis]
MKFFRKDWILYDEIAKDGGKRPDTLIELRIRQEDTHNKSHLPVIKKTEDGYSVEHNASGANHDMTIKHHLVTVVLVVDDQWKYRFDYKVGDHPTVNFDVPHGSKIEAYSFCNLHGLYYSTLKD